VESEHRRGERNRRQTGSMYTPAYRVLVSSEFTEGSFIPRQTGIVCASGQTTWTPECQVLVSSKFREGSFIPRQTGIACAGEQQTRVTSAYLATLQTRPNPSGTVGLACTPSHRAVCVRPARSSAACEDAMLPPASVPLPAPLPHPAPAPRMRPVASDAPPHLCRHRAPPRRRPRPTASPSAG
jgi:hypothetical protein